MSTGKKVRGCTQERKVNPPRIRIAQFSGAHWVRNTPKRLRKSAAQYAGAIRKKRSIISFRVAGTGEFKNIDRQYLSEISIPVRIKKKLTIIGNFPIKR